MTVFASSVGLLPNILFSPRSSTDLHASLGENGATLLRQRGGASLRAVSREIYGGRGKFIDSISAIFNRGRRVRARLEFANERAPSFFFPHHAG